MHDPRVQGAGKTFQAHVDNLDTELSPHRFSCVMEGHFPDPEPLSTPHAVGVDRHRARLDIRSPVVEGATRSASANSGALPSTMSSTCKV